jgi:hypothetical protein
MYLISLERLANNIFNPKNAIDTYGGKQTLHFRAGKIQLTLSINPACRQAGLRAVEWVDYTIKEHSRLQSL